jgi:4-hydroxy-3-methylbut-2-enyl diphosphate reductase
VPDILVMDLLSWLAERGWADVEEVTTANEKVAFALPRELRQALKTSVR